MRKISYFTYINNWLNWNHVWFLYIGSFLVKLPTLSIERKLLLSQVGYVLVREIGHCWLVLRIGSKESTFVFSPEHVFCNSNAFSQVLK
jgi:hypothetical protein